MSRVLLTAFGPYDEWQANASWLALVELTRDLPAVPQITTRLYPVNYAAVCEQLEHDLLEGYDVALHLGQAPGAACLQLETVGLNIGVSHSEHPDQHRLLVDDGPLAYRTALPLADWAARLREAEIPARVSYHAGTYLCNAILYLSHHCSAKHQLATQSAFIHVPLTPSQIAARRDDLPTLPATLTAQALRLVLSQLNGRQGTA